MSVQGEIQRRRTFAIISHPDAGKTTLTEKLLYHGGAIHATGEVKGKGGTRAAKSDWMKLEQEKGISITSSVMQFDYNGHRINLLDTPGHKDFGEDTYRTLMAADCAIMLIDVAKGVEERTKQLYEVCRYRQVPVFTFINKCDRDGVAPLDLIDDVENTLNMKCYPVTWPIGTGDLFKGIYNRFSKELMLYDQRRDDVHELEIVPIKGYDDERLLKETEGPFYEGFIEELELLDGVLPPFDEAAFLRGEISPVTFGSAKQNFAVDTFLDFFTKYAPAPAPRKTRSGDFVDPLDKNFSAFVFKIQANMDRNHRDRVAFMRICSGVFERGMKAHHSRLGRELRMAYSSQFMAGERETVDNAYAGDILGINDTGHFQVGDTVSTSKKISFEAIPKFAPELFCKLSIRDALRRKKMQDALKQLAQEGLIQLFIDPAIGEQEFIIGVIGELQFTVLTHRLSDEYGLEVKLNREPFAVARWPRKEGLPIQGELAGGIRLYRDLDDNPVILLNQKWDLNWAQKENPDIEFCTSITSVR